jgi:hypothetical protein
VRDRIWSGRRSLEVDEFPQARSRIPPDRDQAKLRLDLPLTGALKIDCWLGSRRYMGGQAAHLNGGEKSNEASSGLNRRVHRRRYCVDVHADQLGDNADGSQEVTNWSRKAFEKTLPPLTMMMDDPS